MDIHGSWKVTWAIVSFVIFLNFLEASRTYDHESLEAFVCDKANQEIAKPRTGTLYNIPLPSNFSGMKFSVLRIRSGSLRLRGVNSSYFNLPPWIKPQPYVNRMAIVYENLGNWSSHYYNVPNYTVIAPVLGLMAYDSSETSIIQNKRLNLSILGGDPIKVRFFQSWVRGKKEEVPVCAKFGDDGRLVELKNMSKPYVCETHSQGHYALVVPSLEEAKKTVERQKYYMSTRWLLVLGIGGSSIGLVSVGLVLMGVVRVVKRKRIRRMEEKAEKGEAFDEFWVGESKMPSASMIRTQPELEH